MKAVNRDSWSCPEKNRGRDFSLHEHVSRTRSPRPLQMAAISLRRRIGTSGLIWGLWKACVYLAAIASWDIFSATPSGNGLSPVLRAVPNLSISHDETSSLGAGASFAAVCNLSA